MHAAEALERTQWDLFWVPPGVRIVVRPELQYLVSPDDDSLNTVTKARLTPAQVDAAVAEVSQAHRHSRSRWMLMDLGRSEALERALKNHGYVATHEHHGAVLTSATHQPRNPRGIVVRRIETVDDLRAAAEVTSRAFGTGLHVQAERLQAELRACTGVAPRVHRFVALDAQRNMVIASAGMNVYPTLDLGFLWGGGTVPEARGRGAYAALLDARLTCAQQLGLSRVGVFARVGTSAPIVAKLGFQRAGTMTYWERPAQPPVPTT